MGFFDDDDSGDDDDHRRNKNKPMEMMSLESLMDDDDHNKGDDDDISSSKPTTDENATTDRQKINTSNDDVEKSPPLPRFDDDHEDDTMKESKTASSQLVNKPKGGADSTPSHNNDAGDDNDEADDPLDAYMKSIDQQKEEESSSKGIGGSRGNGGDGGGRLDMENEDEATGHWDDQQQQHPSTSTSNELSSSKSSSSHEFYSSFHRESNNATSGEDRNVNIQLQRIHHNEMNYTPFKKCFLDMQGGYNTSELSNNNNLNRRSSRNTHEGQKWRKQHAILCTPPLDPIYALAELRDVLPSQVIEWNTTNNLTKPTLVQSQTLGVALCGNDAIVTASTGSGKTLAYLWPCVTHLMENDGRTNNDNKNDHDIASSVTSSTTNQGRKRHQSRALILVPTRELALQVEKVAKSLFANLPLTALAITGGNMGRYQLSQKLQSSKPQLVIATPGRLLDVLSAQQKNKQDWLLPNITFLVLDEADKMISLGFANQVTQILQSLRPDRQSLLTSATFDSRLQRRCQEWMHSPTRISVGKTGESSKHVLQHVVCLPTPEAKLEFLRRSLPTFVDVGRTLVFCRTREGVETLASELKSTISVETMHGDKHPTGRKSALKAFTKGDVRVLLATDVAGRGLDIPQVSTVINYDPAKNWDTHVHRIGRAGRMSSQDQQRQEGSAYTLLLPTNIDFAKALIRAYEREGRAIPDDVRNMTNRSNRHNNKKRTENHTSAGNTNSTGGLGYYGDVSNKKGRWS